MVGQAPSVASCGTRWLPWRRSWFARSRRKSKLDHIEVFAKGEERELAPGLLWMLGAAVEGEKSGPITSRRTKSR